MQGTFSVPFFYIFSASMPICSDTVVVVIVVGVIALSLCNVHISMCYFIYFIQFSFTCILLCVHACFVYVCLCVR